MNYQPETLYARKNIKEGTIAAQSADLGMRSNEPLIVAMDAMIRYARAHYGAYNSRLAEDFVLRGEFKDVITGLRALLNGDGAVAMERDITTDSKDNGMIEDMFWDAARIAGFKEEDF